MTRVQPPLVNLRNAQRSVAISARELRAFARLAISLVWPRRRATPGIPDAVLISIVSDKRMAQLHEQFCGITGPTDVLTFQHGEIIISAATAARQARTYGVDVEREMRLYILHGLLHLCGYDDRTGRARTTMEHRQSQLLAQALRLERRRSFERKSSRVILRDAPAASREGGSNKIGHRQRDSGSTRHRKSGGDEAPNGTAVERDRAQ